MRCPDHGCKKGVVSGRTRCWDHLISHNAAQKKYLRKKAAGGICRAGGCNAAAGAHVYCAEHRAKMRARLPKTVEPLLDDVSDIEDISE